MDLNNLKKCAYRQELATAAIVEKLVGLPADLIEVFPVIAKKSAAIHVFFPGIFGSINEDYVNPYVMNGAFALELKMKYLHALETGERMESTHRLDAIFSALSGETKKVIRDQFSKITTGSKLHKDTAKHFNQAVKIQFDWDVYRLLVRSSMAFERWRYIYDGDGSTWFAGYSELQKSLDVRINELRQK